ncbi:MAG: DUF2065 domain-containing protein [Desulfobacteraceae bacterium]
MKFFLCVMGMVLVLEGLPWFAVPEKMKDVMRVMLEQEDSLLRRFGFVMMLLGVVFVFIGKH